MKRKQRRYFIYFMAPSFIGVCIFVLLPFTDVVRRSFMTGVSEKFAGFDNYKKVIINPAFRLAVYNTLKFIVAAIPILICVGFVAAVIINKINDNRVIKTLYLFPMAIPTATIVIVWRMFFYQQNFDSLVVSFLWKNIGCTIILWIAGIVSLSKELDEAAYVDGANKGQCLIYIKLPCLKTTLNTICVLSLLNSVKIYREAYLVSGAYPSQDMYLIQHIFNNWYVNLELDKLSAATVLVGIFLMIVILILNHSWQNER